MNRALLLAGLALALASCTPCPPQPAHMGRYHETARPAWALDGIKMAESSGRDDAVGDDGKSKGGYQINETFHDYYADLYGEYDPFDPVQSRRVAMLILRDNYRQLGVWDWSIAAYRQGVTGVRKDGPTQWYIDRVRRAAR